VRHVNPATQCSAIAAPGKWNERVSSGIPDLDKMLEGPGYYRGTSILVTGTAGSGKTSVSAAFIDAACR
jgi:circadian clock protein KaiC